MRTLNKALMCCGLHDEILTLCNRLIINTLLKSYTLGQKKV